MSDLVGNPEDRFSHITAHLYIPNISLGAANEVPQALVRRSPLKTTDIFVELIIRIFLFFFQISVYSSASNFPHSCFHSNT